MTFQLASLDALPLSCRILVGNTCRSLNLAYVTNILHAVNDLINAPSLMNASYLINAPLS